MKRFNIRRLIGVTTVAALLLTAVAVGPVSAANPTWTTTFTNLPDRVKAGNDAGWEVVVKNIGPSQINDLNILIDSTSTTDAYSHLSNLVVSTGATFAPESCSTTDGVTTCNVGTVNAGTTVTFKVAFPVADTYTGKTFNLTILLRAGTGDTDSDGPGKSRGDKQPFSPNPPTQVSTDPNFDGGFVVDEDTYTTTGALGRNNRQTSEAVVTDTLVPVTVEDGITDITCTADAETCSHLIGDWTDLRVPGNTDPIKLTLFVWGGSVPGGVSADDIFIVHNAISGTYLLGDDPSERCASATASWSGSECIYVTKVGSNFKILVWLAHNGTLRGSW